MHKDTPRHLRFASGYTDLAMFDDTTRELEGITFEDRFALPVLEARLNLCMAAKHWDAAAGVGRELARLAPRIENAWVHCAYALRELGRIEDAREVLLTAEPLHGATSAILHYNLVCYFCLLGDLPRHATAWRGRARWRRSSRPRRWRTRTLRHYGRASRKTLHADRRKSTEIPVDGVVAQEFNFHKEWRDRRLTPRTRKLVALALAGFAVLIAGTYEPLGGTPSVESQVAHAYQMGFDAGLSAARMKPEDTRRFRTHAQLAEYLATRAGVIREAQKKWCKGFVEGFGRAVRIREAAEHAHHFNDGGNGAPKSP